MSITLTALQKQRRDTAANWTSANPTLLAGEIGLESDTGYWKVGDGSTAWTSLAYVSGLGAEIPVNRLADGSARQLLQTAANGTDVEWTSNVDVPGTLDVTGAATFDAAVTIQGDLTVNGTTTTIDTQHLIVEDKNVVIGQVTTPSDVTADGGGITLKGTTDKTIQWIDSTDAWTLSEHVNIASGKEYRINGTKVLDATSLGSNVLITSSNITDGTIVNGDINASAAIAGTKISPDFGSQTILTTGSVGIGTSTPATKFVVSNSGAAGLEIAPAGTGSAPTITSYNRSSAAYMQLTVDSSATIFSTLGSEQMRLESGGLTLQGQNDLRFADSDSSNWVAFQAPATVASNVTWTLPSADGSSSQVLTTNGSGTLSWESAVGSSGGTITGDLLMDNQSDVRFGEATANGSNWVAFQAPASIASNVTWTLPNADATVAGHALKSNAAGVLSWGTAGGATGGGTDDVFYENSQTVTTSYTLTANKNAMSAGPVTIQSGATVTIPSGQSWVIV